MRSISWKTHLPSSQLPHYSTDRYGSSLHSKEAQQALVHHTYGKLMDVARRSMQEEPRERFAEALQSYMKQEKYRRGHVKFITFALHQLEEFGLQQDLLTYNRLIDIFPKDRFKPDNIFDAFWPKPHPQIEVALQILTKMEENAVIPDLTTHKLLVEIFGHVSFPVQKCYRMAYWFSKYVDVDPYWIAGDLPSDPLELNRLALFRIAGENGVLDEVKVSSSYHGLYMSCICFNAVLLCNV